MEYDAKDISMMHVNQLHVAMTKAKELLNHDALVCFYKTVAAADMSLQIGLAELY